MKSACTDKQNKVSFYRAVFCGDGAALNDWQNITLHTFTRDIGAIIITIPDNLINFIDKNNPVLLRFAQTNFLDLIHIDHFLSFLVCENLTRILYLNMTFFLLRRQKIAENIIDVNVHIIIHSRHDTDGFGAVILYLDLDNLVFHLSIA
ncbi:hypothetical protein SDC9_144353 [bioreactor metagenome]|uniref:Uncharacterized protein n=1 Tax=bioreactor metagenome TaxID=1076179 RepID=A0A645E5V8_9ZZZZ